LVIGGGVMCQYAAAAGTSGKVVTSTPFFLSARNSLSRASGSPSAVPFAGVMMTKALIGRPSGRFRPAASSRLLKKSPERRLAFVFVA